MRGVKLRDAHHGRQNSGEIIQRDSGEINHIETKWPGTPQAVACCHYGWGESNSGIDVTPGETHTLFAAWVVCHVAAARSHLPSVLGLLPAPAPAFASACATTMSLRGGFVNPGGTTCFANSVLQSLFHLHSIVPTIRTHASCDSRSCLACPLRALEADLVLLDPKLLCSMFLDLSGTLLRSLILISPRCLCVPKMMLVSPSTTCSPEACLVLLSNARVMWLRILLLPVTAALLLSRGT